MDVVQNYVVKLYNKTNHSVPLYETENLDGITQILVRLVRYWSNIL
jgi:hypothetical protein